MPNGYKKLVIDPRCLKPAYLTNNRHVYIDALRAINRALKQPYITENEKILLDVIKLIIKKNKLDTEY